MTLATDKLSLYWLNELELLRGVNAISQSWGGVHVGDLGMPDWRLSEDGREIEDVWPGQTFRNQWLISAELKDNVPPGLNPVPLGRHHWSIRLGFCQTKIQNAPPGGFNVTWTGTLKLAWSVDALVGLFEVMTTPRDQRRRSMWTWLDQALAYRARMDDALRPGLWDMSSLVREDALDYALANGQIT